MGAAAAATAAAVFLSLGTAGGYVLALTTVLAAVGSRGGPLLGQLAARSYFLLLAAITAPILVVVREPVVALQLVAALVALLAPDPEPLREASDRRGFAPLASRDGFLVSATVAMTAAAVLTLSAGFELVRSSSSILGWSSLGLALVAATGVVATLRMRAAGFVALATAGATSTMLALALLDGWVRHRLGAGHDPFVFTSFAMGGAAFSTMWVPLLTARYRALGRLRVEAEAPATIRYLANESPLEAPARDEVDELLGTEARVPDGRNVARLAM